ncbi:MAG: acetyl-CoA carboxylase, carboxyltransferase subunit beta [Chitinophagaceae bacterium]|nr:acetyl-CoA carboxylase, carboxyltransferase subunit beta [Chitinophagaceae bacterium]
MTEWFHKNNKGIRTSTDEKKDVPDGMWRSTPSGLIHIRELKNNCYVSPEDGFHIRIGSKEYFEILFDKNDFTELNTNIYSTDPLEFTDTQPYKKRIKTTMDTSNLKDAIRCAYGTLDYHNVAIACMDFMFIGGSMGSVVGEKISRTIDYCLKTKTPLIIISKSGGARMMEGSFSLMQMAKTSAKLFLLSESKIPYISVLTDPTTGGVTASYAMLGDFNIGEIGSVIGFAGARVIKDTIGKELPAGFQKSEFLLEHGFLDIIVDRRQLKSTISNLLKMIRN